MSTPENNDLQSILMALGALNDLNIDSVDSEEVADEDMVDNAMNEFTALSAQMDQVSNFLDLLEKSADYFCHQAEALRKEYSALREDAEAEKLSNSQLTDAPADSEEQK